MNHISDFAGAFFFATNTWSIQCTCLRSSMQTSCLKDRSETIGSDIGSPSCTIASIIVGDSVNS
jgi:hypothetical protein